MRVECDQVRVLTVLLALVLEEDEALELDITPSEVILDALLELAILPVHLHADACSEMEVLDRMRKHTGR